MRDIAFVTMKNEGTHDYDSWQTCVEDLLFLLRDDGMIVCHEWRRDLWPTVDVCIMIHFTGSEFISPDDFASKLSDFAWKHRVTEIGILCGNLRRCVGTA
jgi:hypothetical protein